MVMEPFEQPLAEPMFTCAYCGEERFESSRYEDSNWCKWCVITTVKSQRREMGSSRQTRQVVSRDGEREV